MTTTPRRCVAALLCLSLAAAAWLVSPARPLLAQSRGPSEPIVAVRVEGNETIPEAVILQHTTIKSGRTVTDREMLDDVRSLYETKWFSRVTREVRDTPQGPEVVFLVKELPQVASVRYVGNDKKSDEQLSRVTGLEPGSPYRVMFNRDAAEQLRRYYIEEGYRHAKVTLARGESPDDRDVVFQIKEGPKVRVGKISIEGNAAFSDAILKRDLETKTKLLGLVPLFGLFDPTTIPRDEAALTDYYRDLGYFDVKVTAEVAESEDRSEIYVTFNVDEGVRYRIRNVVLEGNEKLSDEVLLPDPELKPGDYYNARFLRKDRGEMEKLYGAEGRLFTKILPVPEFLDEPGTIDLKYRIDEDKKRYIRYVNATVLGDHPHTQRSLIHNQCLVHPGDLADPELIRKSKARIGGSPVFGQNVDLTVRPVEEQAIQPAGYRGQSPDPARRPRGSNYLPARPAPLNALPARPAPLPSRGRAEKQPVDERSAWMPSELFRQTATLAPAWTPSAPAFEPAVEPLVTQKAPKLPDVAVKLDPFAPLIRAQSPGPPQPTIAQVTPRTDVWEKRGYLDSPGAPVVRGQSPPPRPAPMGTWQPAPGGPPPGAPTGTVVTADGYANPYQTIQQTGGDLGPGVSNPLLPQSPNGGPFQGPFREPPPFQEPPGFVDIDIAATEERTGRFMVGAAVNSSSGLVGQVTLQEDNFDLFRFPRSFQELRDGTAFRGRGQRLRIEAVPGAEVSRYLISLTDPFFLDTQYSAGVSGFYYSRFYDEFSEQRLGGRLTVGRQLSPYWSVVGSSRLESVKIFSPTVPTPPKLQEALGDNALFTVGASLKYDSRDRAILPSEGTFAEFGYTQGLGDFTYPRFDAEAARYWTLLERPDGTGQHVLSVNGSLGVAGDDMPIFENYYLGGYQTLRGFDFRGVSPLQNGVRVGGRFSTFGSVQYRFPILVNDALQGVVFSDFGTVNDSVTLDDFRASVGAGVRVSLPQAFGPAPLAFDFAIPVAGPDFDDEQAFSFNIGVTR